jgi:hypothetical protein
LQKEKSPAEGPPGIIALLQKQIAEIVVTPDVKAMLDKLSFQPVGSTPAAFENQIKNDIVVWGKLANGITCNAQFDSVRRDVWLDGADKTKKASAQAEAKLFQPQYCASQK